MNRNTHIEEIVGVRYTGWAALDRDPQQDVFEFTCPHCGRRGVKPARRERSEYRFTDGFLQDMQGETATCKACHKNLHVAPVVLVHDLDEKRRFEAIFAQEIAVSAN
ncbi:MAG TPA: hypothetical protein VFB23_11070 [Candidatus Acidoferrales bacterium]|nr:hypothetical protein [Candidatus Acidoferrales bacterium]